MGIFYHKAEFDSNRVYRAFSAAMSEIYLQLRRLLAKNGDP